MKRVAIVGNIASGKSEVENLLKSANFKTICADNIVHRLYAEPNVQEKIYNIFETIDRDEIAKIVFANYSKKQELEDILHPLVKEKITDFFNENKCEKFVFVSIPLLFEAKMENMFDCIIFVSADENIRQKRLMKRNLLTQEEAKARIRSQIKEEEKIPKSHFVIENNYDLSKLKNNLQKVLEKLNED